MTALGPRSAGIDRVPIRCLPGEASIVAAKKSSDNAVGCPCDINCSLSVQGQFLVRSVRHSGPGNASTGDGEMCFEAKRFPARLGIQGGRVAAGDQIMTAMLEAAKQALADVIRRDEVSTGFVNVVVVGQ